jgi:hypothetical protein
MADVTDDNDGTSHYKLVLLSAHDTSVIPYVDALLGNNGPKDLWAPYASYVTLELYKVGAASCGPIYFPTLTLSNISTPMTMTHDA